MRTILFSLGAVLAGAAACGCRPAAQPAAPSASTAEAGASTAAAPVDEPPALANLPIEMTVAQRTTTVVPGSKTISLTVDDVTRGQVMASVIGERGDVVLGPTSLREGDATDFELNGATYTLSIKRLNNELIGDDSITVVIAPQSGDAGAATPPRPAEPPAEAPPGAEEAAVANEMHKIAQLIEHVESLEGAVFIRNGQEHTPEEAAEHLKRKFSAISDETTTAEDFITLAASRSSLSGDAYRIRLKDGTEFDAGDYLRQRLAEIEASR